jgi:hypothetical protein
VDVAKLLKKQYVLTLIVLMIGVNTATANQCLTYIPHKAVTLEGLKICESSYNGIVDNYSCQDYQSADKKYRVLYKGGVLPKAILELGSGQQEHLIWSTIFGGKKLTCPLLAPRGIHIHAKHRGTGICLNELDQPIPCSIYEHSPPHQTQTHRYLVYYSGDNKGLQNIKVDTFVFDATTNAMTAELAYQFGLSLLHTKCCNEDAISYLEYAYRLYPNANKYSRAYNNAKFNLSAQKSVF